MTSIVAFIIVVGFCLGLSLTFWLILNSLPLSEREIGALAVKHRMARVVEEFRFSPYWHAPRSLVVDASFKKRMSGFGELYSFDANAADFPAIAASLFGGKRHEWLIVAFAKGEKIVAVWVNKGPDKTQVNTSLPFVQILALAKHCQATALLDFHNHPGKYTVPGPSPQDFLAAQQRGELTVGRGMVYLAFVVGGATVHPYACWAPPDLHPIQEFIRVFSLSPRWNPLANFRLRTSLPLGALWGSRYFPVSGANHNLG